MARGMTKATCVAFEKLAKTEISKVLGEPTDFHGTGALTWSFPYGETGTVEMVLWCDSQSEGHVYRSSWLHTRLRDPNHVGADGYTKRRDQIEGGWPYQFTYPSGKNNHHPGHKDDLATMRRELAGFLYSLAKSGSPEKEGFGAIEFEPKYPA